MMEIQISICPILPPWVGWLQAGLGQGIGSTKLPSISLRSFAQCISKNIESYRYCHKGYYVDDTPCTKPIYPNKERTLHIFSPAWALQWKQLLRVLPGSMLRIVQHNDKSSNYDAQPARHLPPYFECVAWHQYQMSFLSTFHDRHQCALHRSRTKILLEMCCTLKLRYQTRRG